MRNVILLSGPMGSGIRPKKYFEATKELMRKQTRTSPKKSNATSLVPVDKRKTA